MPTRILLISIGTNIGLTLLKIIGGLMTGSAGLVADGFHSLTDVISMVINYCGMKISLKPASGLEAYDNYKKEIIGTLVVSFVLFFIGLFILIRSYLKLLSGVAHCPGLGATFIIAAAFLITLWLYYYSKRESEASDSPALAVNTVQIKLNVLSTLAVLAGVIGGFFDMNHLDAVAAIIVSLIILYSAVDIICQFMKDTKKAALSREQVEAIKARVAETDRRVRIARIKSMLIRNKIWLFLELAPSQGLVVNSDLMNRLKRNLLPGLPFLDNVIVGTTACVQSEAPRIEIEDFGRELTAARNHLSLVMGILLVVVIATSAFGIRVYSREYRVLIPADKPDENAGVSDRLGRAPYFYIYRVDKGKGRFVGNPLARSPGHIEPEVVQLFRDYCIEAVITSNVGPYVFEHLTDGRIVLYRVDATLRIGEIISKFKRGELERISRPTVGVRFGIQNYRLLKPWYNWQSQP